MFKAPILLRFFAIASVIFFCSASRALGAAPPEDTTSYVRIAAIRFEGNKRTKESYLRREFYFKEGDTVAVAKLAVPGYFTRSLYNLQLFNKVDYRADSLTPRGLFVTVILEEEWYWLPSGNLKVAENDINVWLRRPTLYRVALSGKITDENFRGRGEQLSIEGTIGWRRAIAAEYKMPYFNKKQTWGLNLKTGFEKGAELGYITAENKLQFARPYDTDILEKWRAEIQWIYRPVYRTRHIFTTGFESVRIADTVSRYLNPEYLGGGRRVLDYLRLGYSFQLDYRERTIHPLRGWFATAGLSYINAPGNALSIWNFTTGFRLYTRLPAGKWYLLNALRTENVIGKTIPYYFRTPLGYRYIVRGYERKLLEGNHSLLATHELKYEVLDRYFGLRAIPFRQFRNVPLRIYAKCFFDHGAVLAPVIINNNTLVNKYLTGFGAGVDFVTAYEKLLRVEYSFSNRTGAGLFLHFTELF